MLRSLLIRQGLMVADLALALLILVVGYVAVTRLFEPETVLGTADTDPQVAAPSGAGLLREPKPRTAYDAIAKSMLFGAGAVEEVPAAAPAEVSPEERQTTLPLRLFGTAAAFPTDPLGSAIIETAADKRTAVYFLNQPVMDNVVLAEIHHQKVILFNQATNTREILEAAGWLDKASGTTGAPAVAARADRGPAVPRDAIPINRAQVEEELAKVNFAELYATVAPEMALDDAGNTIGLTSKNISQIPLARQFGFQDGDVLTQINGVTIDSESRALEVVNRFQNAPTHWVSVIRNGRPQTLVFKVE